MTTANKEASMPNAVTLAVVSSVSVFFLTSIIFFLFGYVCGCRRKCSKSDRQISENVDPVYENTMPGPAELTTEQVDLTKNEAYGLFNIGISQS